MDRGGTVYTVGHGTRSLEELAEVLKAAQVQVLVDVRRFPGSRRHPHFARDRMEASLPEMGLAYEWLGQELGGRRKPAQDSPNTAWRNDAFRGYADHMHSEEFRSALRALEERATVTSQAVMCAETLWWRCHRRLIADALVADALKVVHLGLGRDAPHQLHPAARMENGRIIYDVGATPPLPG